MIIFDQLRISDDGSRMYINLHVNTADYFKDIYLDNITIMTADKVLEATYEGAPTDNFIYKETFGQGVKEADLVLDKGVLDAAFNNWDPQMGRIINPSKPYAQLSFEHGNFSQDLFFVYVKVNGEPDMCTPCSLDKEITVGVTFDENVLYQRVMNYTNELADDCAIPNGFTDFILLWNAFKASVETDHYVPAVRFYNMLFGRGEDGKAYGPYGSASRNMSQTKGCGCHG